jgi:predicted ester cyclase
MSIEENKAIFRRQIEEIWNKGNLDVADEIVAPDATCPTAPQLPPGPAGLKMIASMFRQAFPDLQIEIDKLVATEDRVAGRLIQRGTHQGEFMGIAPTGKQVDFTEISLVRMENGKIVETWFETDGMRLMQQLGVMPTGG